MSDLPAGNATSICVGAKVMKHVGFRRLRLHSVVSPEQIEGGSDSERSRITPLTNG